MAATIVLVFVTRDAVVKRDLTRQSTFGQKLQRAINRRKANARIALAYELMKLFGGEVLVSFEKREQDGVALLSPLEADTLQMLLEAVLRLAQRLLQDRNVIIDAFLQHAAPDELLLA